MQNAGKFAQNLGARMRQAAKEAGKQGSGGGGSPSGGGPVATIVTALAATGAISYVGYKSVVIIQPGHMGVVYNRIGGLEDRARLQEGLNFVIPFFPACKCL